MAENQEQQPVQQTEKVTTIVFKQDPESPFQRDGEIQPPRINPN